MKVLRFKKVATSTNDANIEYYVPADRILAMVSSSTNNTLTLRLKAIAGTSNDTAGDTIVITATGAAETTGDLIAEHLYGNMANGASPVIDANFNNSAISALVLTAV
jgi:hypothetical protein|tara:strand:- start:312 stop:632 length:321 start_codon:yes stop_codon:yes gene_type:complete